MTLYVYNAMCGWSVYRDVRVGEMDKCLGEMEYFCKKVGFMEGKSRKKCKFAVIFCKIHAMDISAVALY